LPGRKGLSNLRLHGIAEKQLLDEYKEALLTSLLKMAMEFFIFSGQGKKAGKDNM